MTFDPFSLRGMLFLAVLGFVLWVVLNLQSATAPMTRAREAEASKLPSIVLGLVLYTLTCFALSGMVTVVKLAWIARSHATWR